MTATITKLPNGKIAVYQRFTHILIGVYDPDKVPEKINRKAKR